MARILIVLLVATSLTAAEPQIVSIEKIWDQGKHNAFTDLLRWHDKWYCTFREADAHIGGDGQLRVLESTDGKYWGSIALVREKGIDLRDPKLSITPDDRLMVVAGGSVYEGKTLKGRQPRVCFSKDGQTWSEPQRILTEGEWLWRVTWHGDTAYGVSYNAAERKSPAAKDAAKDGKVPPGPADWKLKLVSSKDGLRYDLITHLDVPGHPNETTLRFLPDSEMIALVRREGGNTFGWIGRSKAPYKDWTWSETKHRLGGPNFVQIPDGSLWAAGRSYPGGAKTVLARMSAAGAYDPALSFPSGGDTSYPGLVWHNGLLWMSYYSSHEGKSAIYLAQIRMSDEPLPKPLAAHFAPPPELADDYGTYKSLLRFDDGTEVKTADAWRRRRQEILKTWHDLMGPWPEPIARPKIDVLKSELVDNYTRNHVRLEVAPGKSTEDAYILVPNGKGPFPAAVVVFYDAATGVGLGKKSMRDFAHRLAAKGFVTLSLGSAPETYYPNRENCKLQPLSYHAYVASNCRRALASRADVDPKRIGIVGHSYGGKWAMFAACLDDGFACCVTSDPGIVFDEKRSNVNYWEPWYLGFDPNVTRKRGIPSALNPRTGPYLKMMADGRDLHELHALMAPRPFLVSGGSEDLVERWRPLNRTIEVNKLLGYANRVGLTLRKGHDPTAESNEQIDAFFEHWLKARR